jgi:hypothetical protein
LDNGKKRKCAALLTGIMTLIIISPIDDIALAAVFGTALFGFGSIPFYLLMAGSSAFSVIFWVRRKRAKQGLTNNAEVKLAHKQTGIR